MHKDLFKQNHHLVDGVRNLRSSHASAAGVIYELAGRENKGAGKNKFISNLEKRESQASRLVWKSVDKNKDRFITNVERAFKDAQAALQKQLDTRRV
jgi:hypothetical protein